MIQKILLLTLIFLYSSTIFSQNTIEETTLEELEITSKKKKKIKKHKISGSPFFYYFAKNDFTVTGVNQLPKGNVKAVNFAFNTKYNRIVGSMFDEINTDFIDVDFGIMLFEMKKDGTIGKLISDSDIKFKISKNHQGDFRIDLTSLDLPDEGFFIGIKVLSETLQNEASFYVSMCDNDNYTSYQSVGNSRNKMDNVYLNLTDSHLKMTLEIEQ